MASTLWTVMYNGWFQGCCNILLLSIAFMISQQWTSNLKITDSNTNRNTELELTQCIKVTMVYPIQQCNTFLDTFYENKGLSEIKSSRLRIFFRMGILLCLKWALYIWALRVIVKVWIWLLVLVRKHCCILPTYIFILVK